MIRIPFHKMSGSGNDFIVIDNRRPILPDMDVQEFARRVCRRRVSAGADGLILVENSNTVDFKWRFFNSDGSVAEMCGNGSRCVARFAHLKGLCGPGLAFETVAGIVSARVKNNRVKVTMPRPSDLKLDYKIIRQGGGDLSISSVNTGVPHMVVTEFDPDDLDVVALGRELRFHPLFSPAGTNVNFISIHSDKVIHIRTYERGVEGETLACGTGAVAAAIIGVYRFEIPSPVHVVTRSGEMLTIYIERDGNDVLSACLEGGTRLVYEGVLTEEAWQS
jgi:diaminopimelate epimerase